MIFEKIKEGFEVLAVSIVASIFMLIMGIIYFGIIIWVIRVSTTVFFGSGLSADWAVMASSILATGSILAGALEKKK